MVTPSQLTVLITAIGYPCRTYTMSISHRNPQLLYSTVKGPIFQLLVDICVNLFLVFFFMSYFCMITLLINNTWSHHRTLQYCKVRWCAHGYPFATYTMSTSHRALGKNHVLQVKIDRHFVFFTAILF